MFASRLLVILAAVAVAVALALSAAAQPTSRAAGPAPYVVQPGDTLWAIASARYDGDLRKAIWEIRQRNGLESAVLQPGQVLDMPP
jgi:nucleoid-associated protein YgaU